MCLKAPFSFKSDGSLGFVRPLGVEARALTLLLSNSHGWLGGVRPKNFGHVPQVSCLDFKPQEQLGGVKPKGLFEARALTPSHSFSNRTGRWAASGHKGMRHVP